MPESPARQSESETGIVTAIIDDEAIIELSAQETCESCGARMICMPDERGKRRLRASNPPHAHVGNLVAVTEKSNFLLLVSFFQYGVPLIFFFLFIFTFYLTGTTLWSWPKELVWFIGGLAGIFCGALVSRFFLGRLAASGSSFFEITRILNQSFSNH